MEAKPVPARVTTWFVLCSVVAMLHFAREFLIPVALAVFVAFVLAPLVRRLERIRLPRAAAAVVTMAAVGLLAAAIGWVLVGQLQGFAEEMPGYRANVRAKAADLRSTFAGTLDQAASTVRELGQDLTNSPPPGGETQPPATVPAPATTGGAFELVQDALGSVANVAVVVGLVLLLAFVMLLRWDDLRDRLLALAGEHDLELNSRAAKEAAARVGVYLRRQLLLNCLHGTAMGLVLWWIGVPTPLVWGMLGASLRFVPYLGPLVSTAAPVLISFASSPGWTQTSITLGALLGLELVSNNVLEPWIYGAATGISPFALLVSTAFWTWIWGPVGLVLATPLTVCLLVIGKRFPATRFLDVLFREAPALPRHVQLYHRLLADDQDDAWEILRHEAAGHSLVEAVDGTFMPALGLAGIARLDGRLDVGARERIGALAHGLVDELADLPRTPSSSVCTLRVLCVPARDSFDAVGGRLLAVELGRRGCSVTEATPDRLVAEVLDVIRRGEVDVVVVSSVVPTHFLHVRSLCKRLLALETPVHLLVGLWAEELPDEEVRSRLPNSPRLHVATTIAQAIARIDNDVPCVRAERLPRAAAGF